MRYVCIIQARTTSTRLPAKCFLPIAKMPLIILCAKRATSSFADTWVAISNHFTDDLLAHCLENFKIPYFRGNLNNVLDRFCALCLRLDIKPEDTIIRLTGDNSLIDNKFLGKMKLIWENYDLDYLSAEPDNLIKYGWPKGLSAEFFKAKSIYSINNIETDEYIKEHVTPSIKKKSKLTAHMAKFENINHYFKRSYGIDTLEDYLYVANLFKGVKWNTNYIKLLELGKKEELNE